MKICPSLQAGIPVFRASWNAALDYQQTRDLPSWPPFPEEKIQGEIRTGLHFSAWLPDGSMAGYFSLALSDPLIWGTREQGDAIYVHRMCVNPSHKGSRLACSVLRWTHAYAASLGRKFVRMDTWADNASLVRYYVSCGFHYIGDHWMGEATGLAPHYRNAKLALFQNACCSSDPSQ